MGWKRCQPRTCLGIEGERLCRPHECGCVGLFLFFKLLKERKLIEGNHTRSVLFPNVLQKNQPQGSEVQTYTRSQKPVNCDFRANCEGIFLSLFRPSSYQFLWVLKLLWITQLQIVATINQLVQTQILSF